MQATDTFKNIIDAHLKSVAASDSLFAETLKKPTKNINDCVTYILNSVKNSGCNGFADEEIFGMAVHYYDEDNIEVGKPISGRVVVNHHVEGSKKSTPAPAQPDAKKPVKKAKAEQVASVNQISLF